MSKENFQNLNDVSMADLFRREVGSQSAILTEGLLALERDPTATEKLGELMRAAHSLKGAAGNLSAKASASKQPPGTRTRYSSRRRSSFDFAGATGIVGAPIARTLTMRYTTPRSPETCKRSNNWANGRFLSVSERPRGRRRPRTTGGEAGRQDRRG